jgi:hypothetical protein
MSLNMRANPIFWKKFEITPLTRMTAVEKPCFGGILIKDWI